MNVNGIYAKQSDNMTVQKQKEQSANTYEKGQVIEGIISKVSEKVSINFSGREINFSKDTIQNAREGEVRQFQITNISESSIVLKEVGSSKENVINNGKSLFTTVNTDSLSIFGNIGAGQSLETDDKLNDISNQMTEDDYDELSKEGFTIEEYELERLERALARIKQQKSLIQDSLESQVVDKEETREEVEETAKANITDSAVSEIVATRLSELNLPVTKENVDNMISAMELSKEANKLNDGACVYLIENQLKPTVENIYKAVHSGTKNNNGNEAVWAELEEVVKNIIEEADMPVNEENLQNAKFLIDNELAVTSENIKYKNLLDQIKQRDNTMFALEEAALAIQNKSISEGVVLPGDSNASAISIIKDFNSITPSAISRAIQKELTKNLASTEEEQEAVASKLTLEDLKEAQAELSSEENSSQKEVTIPVNANNVAEITAKRQLEEIRLKLTTESANAMAAKGIHIETEGLSKVVEELKKIEDTYYQKLMNEVGGTGEEQLSLLKETTESINSLKAAPATILGATYPTRNIETLQSLSEVGKSTTEQFKAANESYEALMTKPRSDMGDSIQKAFTHIDEMLDSMGLEKTAANERAVRILGYNSIEITDDNITAMKNYDAKVNALFENLTPPVTATLIKNGVNPLKMTVDELNDQAIQLKTEYGKTEEESFSEYLVRLEDNKEITEEERKSYIGVYRLLRQVEKTDGAAVGSLVKAGQEITLNNLLTAVRIGKHGSIDASIDDNFGSLVSVNLVGESITSQINSAYNENNSANADESASVKEATEYQNQILKQLMEEITPEKINNTLQTMEETFGDVSLETLKEQFNTNLSSHGNGDAAVASNMESIRKLAESTSEEQKFLKEYEIPNSLNNIAAAKAMNENSSILFENIQALKKSIQNAAKSEAEVEDSSASSTEEEVGLDDIYNTFLDSTGDPEELVKSYEELQTETQKLFDSALEQDEVSVSDLRLMNDIRNVMNLTVNLSKKEYYSIPIQTQNGVTAMNLTVVHQGEQKGSASISLPSETLGTIKAELSITDKKVKCFITAENKTTVDLLQKEQDALTSQLEENGLTTQELYFDTKEPSENSFIYKSGSIYKVDSQSSEVSDKDTTEQDKKTTTSELYAAAKNVVMFIKQMESMT